MKNAIKRLVGMALTLCMVLSLVAVPTAYAAEITEVNISGISTPVIGGSIDDFTAGITVDAQASYQIDSKNVCADGTTTETADTEFAKGSAYDLVIVLSAKDAAADPFAGAVTANVGSVNLGADGKLTVTADIQAVYKVILNQNYGDTPTTNDVLTDTFFKLTGSQLSAPTRTGWIFKGWNTKNDGSGDNVNAETVFGDSLSEIFAIWEEDKTGSEVNVTDVTQPKLNEAPTTDGIKITDKYSASYKWVLRKIGETAWTDMDAADTFVHGFEYAIQADITSDTLTLASPISVSVNGADYSATPAENKVTVIHSFGELKHTLTKVEKKDSDCKTEGMGEHWKCDCGALFADENGTAETTADKLKIEKKEHTPEENWTTDVQPTVSSQGHRYKNCTVCGTMVAEETIASLVGNVEYEFICMHADTAIYGAMHATCTTAGHTGNKACSWCGQVMSLGQAIPATGHSYVNNVCYLCGHVKGSVDNVTDNYYPDNWIPKTGDESQPMVYAALILMAAATVIGVVAYGKKRATGK